MSKKTKAQALLATIGILVSLGLFGEGVKAEVGTSKGPDVQSQYSILTHVGKGAWLRVTRSLAVSALKAGYLLRGAPRLLRFAYGTAQTDRDNGHDAL